MSGLPLLVIGRDPVWRARMQRVLAARAGLDWLGAYAPAQPREQVVHLPPGLLLLDGDDPFVERAPRRPHQPGPRRLYFYRRPDAKNLLHCIETRASGCLEKQAPAAMVLRAMQAAESGLFVTLPVLLLQALQGGCQAPSTPPSGDWAMLTERQREVLHWAARGLSNKQIARELEISPETVKSHLQNVFTREGVHNRVALLALQASRDGDSGPGKG